MHGDDDLVDEFGGMGADAGGAEDLTGLAVGEDLHKAVRLPHAQALAMVIERVGAADERHILLGQVRLAGSNGGDLGMAEDTEEKQPVVDLFDRLFATQETCGVTGADLPLLDAGSTTNELAWQHGRLLRVGEVEYRVEVNPPMVDRVELHATPFVGIPLVPQVQVGAGG